MRIAILLLNEGRGSGEVARHHVRHLVERGHTVYLLYPHIGSGVEGAVNIDVPLPDSTVPVHEHLPSAGENERVVGAMELDEALGYLRCYEDALEPVADEVDLILGHHASLTAIASHAAARRATIPFVLFLHGTGIEPRHQGRYDDALWQLIEEAILAANGILVTTDYVRDQLVRNLVDVPADRFLVLPAGVDLEAFRPDKDDGIRGAYDLPDLFVLSPGALTPMKGPQNVVRASRSYADLAPTVFIGAGHLREELEAAIRDRGRFLGFVSESDKQALMGSAAILTAAPEKLEHFGIIYAEGMAAGAPPVAYRGGGVDSIVTSDVGVLTERHPKALGTAVREILQDPDRREAMATAGRTRAERHFSYPHLIDVLEKWLESLSRVA